MPKVSSERVAQMKISQVFPLYVNKVEKKGRTLAELHEVLEWLTGYDEAAIRERVANDVTFGEFIDGAEFHPDSSLITGVICGYRVEEIEDPFMQKVRYIDKLVDELARGKKLENILRS